jgi:NTP pyrophosphatase (non-canonical NTP hydrolase)
VDANEYQRLAGLTAAPQNEADRMANAVLGIAGEAAELAQLLLQAEWRGAPQVEQALRLIAAIGGLVEPVKKVRYQGHLPPDAAAWGEALDAPQAAIAAWRRLQATGGDVWAGDPATMSAALEVDKFANELGDAQWYVSQGARAVGWELGAVMEANVAKLARRFPAGHFSAEASRGRDE